MVPQHRLLVWNSRRGPHLGSGRVRPHQQTGHMIAIASIRRCSPLVGRGPSTYGSRLSLRSAGMTTEETARHQHVRFVPQRTLILTARLGARGDAMEALGGWWYPGSAELR